MKVLLQGLSFPEEVALCGVNLGVNLGLNLGLHLGLNLGLNLS